MSLHRQIEAFRAVMQMGTMTEASRVLRTSQPAVSRMIMELEQELGLKLFERSKGRAKPTYEALRLINTVEQSFVGLDRIRKAATDLREFREAQVSIAAMPALSIDVVALALARYSEEYPSVRVEIHARSSGQVVESVANGLVDIGLARKPYDFNGIRCDLEIQVPYVCLLPPGHKLENETCIRPDHLANEQIIALTNSDTREFLEDAFRREGLLFRPRIETSLSIVAARHVELGLGLAIVDPYTAKFCEDRPLRVLPFEPKIPFSIGVLSAALKTEAPAVVRFRDMIVDVLHAFKKANLA